MSSCPCLPWRSTSLTWPLKTNSEPVHLPPSWCQDMAGLIAHPLSCCALDKKWKVTSSLEQRTSELIVWLSSLCTLAIMNTSYTHRVCSLQLCVRRYISFSCSCLSRCICFPSFHVNCYLFTKQKNRLANHFLWFIYVWGKIKIKNKL